MHFEIIGEIEDVETIAVASAIRDVQRLRSRYGPGRWRKLKGVASVSLGPNRIRRAELHGYEAHGLGRANFKSCGTGFQPVKPRAGSPCRTYYRDRL
jgi:hypothetical protein